ncbi:MAG: cobalamin-dependent protein [Chitinivibrionales bacterium]|nr:cobalamin-dependent protein [Chitinivibrionales bacterium]
MKILVVNPPFLPMYSRESRSPAVTKSGTLYFPMWLAYAVGFLEKHGHEVLFIDGAASSKSREEILAAAVRFNPGLTVLETSTPSIYSDVEMAVSIKKALSATFTILVGVHVSAVPEQTLQEAPPQLDAVAVSEYDATLVELAQKLSDSTGSFSDADCASIAGIAFRDKKGSVIRTKPREFIADLDSLPFVSSVYKKHLDITPYFYSHSRHPLMVLLTGRGCPYQCTYCVYPQTLVGHQYRKRSIANIVEEFVYIQNNFPQVKEIMIEDDALTADRKRCRDFSQALIDAKATKIPWSANSRADVDLETMRIMKKANCRLFCVGFESGDQTILDNIKKNITIEKIRQFRKDAARAGILIHGCFMVGNKGETAQSMERTLCFAKELNTDTAQFFPIMVYPGTEAYTYFDEKGWITTKDYRKWLTKDGLHSSVVSNPELTYDVLVAFCNRARREFYLRPRFILAKCIQMFTHPKEAKRLLKAFKTFYRYMFS